MSAAVKCGTFQKNSNATNTNNNYEFNHGRIINDNKHSHFGCWFNMKVPELITINNKNLST